MSTTRYEGRLRAADYEIRAVEQRDIVRFVEQHHYARGCSNTAVYRHGLFDRCFGDLLGAVLWLPPTRVACESVDPYRWKQVLSLSRMCVAPGVPKNACSFMLGRSLRIIRQEARFVSFVTYADEAEQHEGGVYRACGWQELGRSGAYPKWRDPTTGRTVAIKATGNRTKAEMLARGYERVGVFGKRKFVLYPFNDTYSKMLRLKAAMR